MEVLTSAWFIFIICCTDLFGFRQCTAFPVPNLLSYYQSSPKNHWNYKYRQSRNPIVFYDKFTFPNKDPLSIEERSGKVKPDSGKIFFPDEISSSKRNKNYHFLNGDNNPTFMYRYRPTSSVEENIPGWQALDNTERISSAVDGSVKNKPTEQQLPLENHEESIYENAETPRSPISGAQNNKNPNNEERVAAALNQFYEWLKRNKPSKGEKPAGPDKFDHYGQNASPPKNCQSVNEKPSVNITNENISDQSLVAGLKDQKCPEGQIRLENGECKVKVSV